LHKHPDLHVVELECASCGTHFTLRTAATALSADVCSNCHPAYTGVERTNVAGSRIDRFNRRRALSA